MSTERRFCPNCRSSNVLVGAFVLECLSCGWHYLNKHPCTVCGKPSTSSYGSNDGKGGRVELYGCNEHPVTKQLGIDVDALAEKCRAAQSDHGSGGVEITPLEFSDEIINTPVLYGEPVPILRNPKPEGKSDEPKE